MVQDKHRIVNKVFIELLQIKLQTVHEILAYVLAYLEVKGICNEQYKHAVNAVTPFLIMV